MSLTATNLPCKGVICHCQNQLTSACSFSFHCPTLLGCIVWDLPRLSPERSYPCKGPLRVLGKKMHLWSCVFMHHLLAPTGSQRPSAVSAGRSPRGHSMFVRFSVRWEWVAVVHGWAPWSRMFQGGYPLLLSRALQSAEEAAEVRGAIGKFALQTGSSVAFSAPALECILFHTTVILYVFLWRLCPHMHTNVFLQ